MKKFKLISNSKGLTLVEVLAVIVVLSIISSLVFGIISNALQTHNQQREVNKEVTDATINFKQLNLDIRKAVSPYSNNAYKTPGTSGTIDVSNKGGACLMPTNKLTIVPVKLEPLTNETSSNNPPNYYSPGPSCVIKTVTAEISFFNGVEERIIQMIMKELNSR